VSPLRPDLVGCWIYRFTPDGAIEILLIRRAQGRLFAGVWQCVTGGLEAGERTIDGALREVAEETGITSSMIETLYTLDQVNAFHAELVDGVLVEAVFAARVDPATEVRLSDEHDDLRWVSPATARDQVVWPAYRTAIEQIEWLVAHPEQEPWFRAGAWAGRDRSGGDQSDGDPSPPPASR